MDRRIIFEEERNRFLKDIWIEEDDKIKCYVECLHGRIWKEGDSFMGRGGSACISCCMDSVRYVVEHNQQE